MRPSLTVPSQAMRQIAQAPGAWSAWVIRRTSAPSSLTASVTAAEGSASGGEMRTGWAPGVPEGGHGQEEKGREEQLGTQGDLHRAKPEHDRPAGLE